MVPTSVTKGTSEDILFESDNSLLGNVQAKGAYGANWLAVEKKQTKDFDSFSVTRTSTIHLALQTVSLKVQE